MLTALVVGVDRPAAGADANPGDDAVFVPKILAIFLVLLIALPFAGAAMATYMDDVARAHRAARNPLDRETAS
jgi:flagellar biosynthetic protein FliQ